MRVIVRATLTVLLAALPRLALSAELRVRAQGTAEGPLVRLGDVAEILGGDSGESESLAGVELFPAPAAHQQRSLSVRELQDLLVLRGVNLVGHQFSGSSQVLVLGQTPSPVARPAPVPAGAVHRTQGRVCEAVVKYLRQHASAESAWEVEANLSEGDARILGDPARTISVAGGQAPWTGPQRFQLTTSGPQGKIQVALEARVSIRAPVVVAVHSLSRGAVVREDDVELQTTVAPEAAGVLKSLAEAIGRETVRAVPAGKVLSTEALRTPFWVHRGEVVTVYARTAGIQVRTVARARDDGARGELVAIDSLLDHGAFHARVSGIREVEVYARAPRVETAEAAGPDTKTQR